MEAEPDISLLSWSLSWLIESDELVFRRVFSLLGLSPAAPALRENTNRSITRATSLMMEPHYCEEKEFVFDKSPKEVVDDMSESFRKVAPVISTDENKLNNDDDEEKVKKPLKTIAKYHPSWRDKLYPWYHEIVNSENMITTQKYLIQEGMEKKRPEMAVLLAIDVVLRGISQVFLCNHPVCGIFVCIGLALTSVNLMWYALLATAIATASAASLGRPPQEDVLAGLCGYDGALVGCACWAFLPGTYNLQAAFLLPVLAGLVHVAFVNFLRTWQLPCFTFAFNVVTIMFLYASSSGAIDLELSSGGAPVHSEDWNTVSLSYVIDASIRGVGQFMFADTTVGSAFVVAGICLSSRKGALVALIGAITGWIMARYVLHASAIDNIRAGLYGYNCAGTCAALSGGIFYKTSDGALLIGVVGAVLASLLTVGFSGLLGGLPVLTFPFIVSTWIIMLSRTRWLTEADEIIKPLMRRISTKRLDSHNQLMSLRMFRSIRFSPVKRRSFSAPSGQSPALEKKYSTPIKPLPTHDEVEAFRAEDMDDVPA